MSNANVDVDKQTTYTLGNLTDGKTYYFTVKAYDSARTTQSDFSSEVSKNISSTTAPVAIFGANPSSGTAPLTVTFTDTSGGGGDGGNSGLVAAYNFEEISGTTVVDASSNGNHGTISGAVRTTSGKYGKALSFDGVDDWVTVKDASSLDLTTGMTLEAWIYPTDNMSGWHGVLLKEDSPTTAAYYLYANSDSDQPAIGFDGSFVQGGPWLVPNTWVHLAGTYDGTTQRLYVNGTEMANQPQSGSIAVTDGVLRIGGDSIWRDFFKGRIDEIRIYNRPLSADEIQTDMNKQI